MTKTLSDVHGKRANRAAGAKPAEFAVDGDGLPVRKVPGELHSATFLHHVGIEANHGDETLSIAHRAFNSMSRVLEQMHKRERTIRADLSKTPANHQMRVAQLVDKNFEAPSEPLQNARALTMSEIDAINAEIENSFRSKMNHEEASEFRAVIRAMTPAKRREYLAAAEKAGNFGPIAAILAHPEAVVSGMSDAERATLRASYERSLHGEAVARRVRLERAVKELEDGWSAYMVAAMKLRDTGADDIAAAAQAADEAVNGRIDLDGGE